MEHEIITDLLPLYADDCCSAASRRAVAAHLAQCPICRNQLQNMAAPLPVASPPAKKPSQINQWKASILQSVLLFACFGLITLGVAIEARIPSGLLNGWWAFVLVVPATGMLLSLPNWFFLRLYGSRKQFSCICCLLTGLFTLVCGIWTLNHYEWITEILADPNSLWYLLRLHAPGIALSGLLILLSKCLSDRYARLMGKE